MATFEPRLGTLRAFTYTELTNPETCPPDFVVEYSRTLTWAIYNGKRYLIGPACVFALDSAGTVHRFSQEEFQAYYKKVD